MSLKNWGCYQRKREDIEGLVRDWFAPAKFKRKKPKRRKKYLVEALYYWSPNWHLLSRFDTEAARKDFLDSIRKRKRWRSLFRDLRVRDLKF